MATSQIFYRYICSQSASGSNGNPPLVLTLAGDNKQPGAQVIVSPQSAAPAASQLWAFDGGGLINKLSLLALDVFQGNTAAGAFIDTWTWEAGANQTWTFEPDGTIRSSLNGYALDLASNEAGAAVVLNPVNGSATQQWVCYPTYPLSSILTQAPVPFPDFSGDPNQAAAWSAVQAGFLAKTQNEVSDVRTAYPNLNFDTSHMLSILNEITCPPTVPADAWSAVTQQLTNEINMVSDARDLYTNYDLLHVAIFPQEEASLTTLTHAAGIALSTTVSGTMYALFEGIVYTVLCSLGPEASFLGNVFETLFNTALAARSPDLGPFETEVNNLWTSLSNGFDAVLAQNGKVYEQLVSDWGMLQAADYCILLSPSDPGTLAWNAEEQAPAVVAATNAYQVSVMQTLLPSMYVVYQYTQIAPADPSNIEPQRPAGTCWIQELGATGAVNYYVLCEPGLQSASASLLNTYVWDMGVLKIDFYADHNRQWPFYRVLGDGSWAESDCMITTIINRTTVDMTVTATVVGGELRGVTTRALPAFAGQVAYLSQHTGGALTGNNELSFVVTDANNLQVASFTSKMGSSVLEGAMQSAESFVVGNDYSLGAAPYFTAVEASMSDDTPGQINVSISPS